MRLLWGCCCLASVAAARPVRLVVDGDGVLRDGRGGPPFLAKGVNFGMRLTPRPGVGGLYNASDPMIARKLLPGLNLVRLVLDYYSDGSCATDIFDASAEGFIAANWLAHIDDVVRWTADAGVKVVITLRNMNGTATPHGGGFSTADYRCESDYIGNATARALWFSTMKFLAARYRHSISIAWFEPASEPHLTHSAPNPKSPSGKPWVPCHTAAEVNELFNGVVAAIRSVDPDTPIAVAPTGYEACPGLDLTYDRVNDSKIIYALNWPCQLGKTAGYGTMYGATSPCSTIGKVKDGVVTGTAACVPACKTMNNDTSAVYTYDTNLIAALYAPALAFRTKHRVPLWIDQLMCPSGAFPDASGWLADSMAAIDFGSTHFSWWAWKANYEGNQTMAVLTNGPGDDKGDATLYQVDPFTYPLYRTPFA